MTQNPQISKADQKGMAKAGVTEDRRKRAVPVAVDRRRKSAALPAWAGTSSRLSTRSKQAQQQRLSGRR